MHPLAVEVLFALYDKQFVFNTDAKLVRKVDARFIRNDHAFLKHRIAASAPGDGLRSFMDGQHVSDAMAGAALIVDVLIP